LIGNICSVVIKFLILLAGFKKLSGGSGFASFEGVSGKSGIFQTLPQSVGQVKLPY